MNRPIRLTHFRPGLPAKPRWVMSDHIVDFESPDPMGDRFVGPDPGAVVTLASNAPAGSCLLPVHETPSEIIQLLAGIAPEELEQRSIRAEHTVRKLFAASRRAYDKLATDEPITRDDLHAAFALADAEEQLSHALIDELCPLRNRTK